MCWSTCTVVALQVKVLGVSSVHLPLHPIPTLLSILFSHLLEKETVLVYFYFLRGGGGFLELSLLVAFDE